MKTASMPTSTPETKQVRLEEIRKELALWDGLAEDADCPKCGAPKAEEKFEHLIKPIMASTCGCKSGLMDEERGLKEELSHYESAQRRIRDNAPGRFRSARVENYPEQSHPALRGARKVIESFGHEDCPSLMLMGGVGTGKTQLVYSLVNSLAEAYPKRWRADYDYFPMVVNVARMIQNVNFAYRDGNPARVLEPLYRTPLLALVDLGKESTTEATRRVLYTLLEERWQQQRPVVVDTNLPSAEALERHYADDPVMQEAISSRLIGMCKGHVYVFRGRDWRVGGKESGG